MGIGGLQTIFRGERVSRSALDVVTEVTIKGNRLALQRRDERNANRLKRNWDEARVGTLTAVELPDGKYHLTDGGSRWLAKSDEPDYMFDCAVYTFVDESGEHAGLDDERLVRALASLFAGRNEGSKNVAYFDRYLIGLTEGEQTWLAVDAGVRNAGLAIDRSPSATKVAAVRALYRIVERAAAACPLDEATENEAIAYEWATAILTRLLETIKGSAVQLDHTAWDADYVQAVAQFYLRWPARLINDLRTHQRLHDTLAKRTPAAWKTLGDSARIAGGVASGGSVSRSGYIFRAILEEYNKRLSDERRLG